MTVQTQVWCGDDDWTKQEKLVHQILLSRNIAALSLIKCSLKRE